MWESDVFEEMNRRARAMLEGAFRLQESLFDLDSRSLKPLSRVEVTDDEVITVFDIPYVEKKDITLASTDTTVTIEAKMRKPVSIKIGGDVQHLFEFQQFAKEIILPVRVDASEAKAKFRNGILTVRFPIAKKRKRLEIE